MTRKRNKKGKFIYNIKIFKKRFNKLNKKEACFTTKKEEVRI